MCLRYTSRDRLYWSWNWPAPHVRGSELNRHNPVSPITGQHCTCMVQNWTGAVLYHQNERSSKRKGFARIKKGETLRNNFKDESQHYETATVFFSPSLRLVVRLCAAQTASLRMNRPKNCVAICHVRPVGISVATNSKPLWVFRLSFFLGQPCTTLQKKNKKNQHSRLSLEHWQLFGRGVLPLLYCNKFRTVVKTKLQRRFYKSSTTRRMLFMGRW